MSEYLSLFSVPVASFDELTALYQQWGEALHSRRDDAEIVRNQVYRQADEVALARVTLPGRTLKKGLIAVDTFIERKVWKPIDKPVLTPEDCRELAQLMARLRERVPDEDVLVRRMYKWKFGDVEPDDVRRAYHALLEALEQTIALDAGLMWVGYDDQAEARLEQTLRERAERKAAAALLPVPTPEESARHVAAMQAEIDALVERGHWMQMRAERELARIIAEHGRPVLYTVDAEHLAKLRPLVRKAGRANDESVSPAKRAAAAKVQAELDARLAERALASMTFEQAGECRAFGQLMRIMDLDAPQPYLSAATLYTPEGVRECQSRLLDWTSARRGPKRAVDMLTVLSEDASREQCQRVYQTVRTFVQRAVKRQPAGLVVLIRADMDAVVEATSALEQRLKAEWFAPKAKGSA